jgi:hypothetical protein
LFYRLLGRLSQWIELSPATAKEKHYSAIGGGCKPVSVRKNPILWSHEELTILDLAVKNKMEWKQIAQLLGRAINTCRSMAGRLNWRLNVMEKLTRWTKEEDRMLIRARKECLKWSNEWISISEMERLIGTWTLLLRIGSLYRCIKRRQKVLVNQYAFVEKEDSCAMQASSSPLAEIHG